VKFVFDLGCVALAVGAIVTLVELLGFPPVAARENVTMFDLILRAQEDGGQHRPTDVLTGYNPLEPDLLNIHEHTGEYIQSIRTTRTGPFEFRHEIRVGKRVSEVAGPPVESTSPHLNVKVEDLRKAVAFMRTVFPDDARRADTAVWGRSLIVAGLATRFRHTMPKFFGPLGPPLTGAEVEAEAEALYAAAVVLRGHQPNAETDLPRLVEMGRAAFPDPAAAGAARKWAAGLLDRWDEILAKLKKDNARRNNAEVRNAVTVPSVTPPRSEWVEWWVVYQFVGLDDASREAALSRWKSKFPPESRHSETEEFGKSLLAARAGAGEPVPPPSAAAPWVALVEHYRGWDAHGARLRALYGRDGLSMGGAFLLTTYPGDDLYMIALAGDSLDLLSPAYGSSLSFLIGFGLFLPRGFRVLILKWIGAGMLRLRTDKRFRRYVDGRGTGRWWVRWPLILVTGVGAFAYTLNTLGPPLSPIAGDNLDILLGCVLAAVFGGAVFTAFTRLAAVVLIRRGVDVERVWYDEFIGLAAAAIMLRYFGNDWGVIGLYALGEVLTTLISHRHTSPRPLPG
jgi:hypothetical protein